MEQFCFKYYRNFLFRIFNFIIFAQVIFCQIVLPIIAKNHTKLINLLMIKLYSVIIRAKKSNSHILRSYYNDTCVQW